MSDFSPSFPRSQRRSQALQQRYFIDDRQDRRETFNPQSGPDYIKVFEYGSNLENFFSGRILAESPRYSGDLTFHPNELAQKMGYNTYSKEASYEQGENIQQADETIGQQETTDEDYNSKQETRENDGSSKVISEYLMEAFKKDNAVLKYLKNMVESDQDSGVKSQQKGGSIQKQGSRPPKYKPPKVKQEILRSESPLRNITEEREEEDLRPRLEVPMPSRISKFEKEAILRKEGNSKSPEGLPNKKKSASKERFPDEKQAYSSLKKFYSSIVDTKKKDKRKTLQQTKKHLEESLFSENKENFKVNGDSRSYLIKRSKSMSEEGERGRTSGQIVRQNKENKARESQWVYYSNDKDVLEKTVAWFNEKYKGRTEVLQMKEKEINETQEVMKREKEILHRIESFVEDWFDEPEQRLQEYVELGYAESNRDIIEILPQVRKTRIFQMINFLQKFSHLDFLREIEENRNKITKVHLSVSKLRRENNKIKKLLKDEVNVTKKAVRKDKKTADSGQMKRTSYQENETKIMMMSDIKLRLMQKNVILVFKWLHCSARTRNRLLERIREAYNKKLLFCVTSGLYSYKQYKLDRKKQQELARDHMKLFWVRQLLENWRRGVELKKQKRSLYDGLVKLSLEKLKKKAFYGIQMLLQYKKVVKADMPLVEKFNEYRLVRKVFLSLKYSKNYEEIFKDKKSKNFENFYSGKPLRDPREKPLLELVLKDSQAMAKIILNRLSILSSRRDYYYDPLRRIRTLMRGRYATSQGTNVASALPNLIQLNNQSFVGRSQNENLALSGQVPTDITKALVYKRKRYILGQITQGSVFEELRDHLKLLIKVKGTLQKSSVPLPDPPKGMINVQSLQKFYREREERKIKGSLFTKWKVAFIEKWTDIESDLYHTMNLSKMALQKLKTSLQNRKQLEENLDNHLRERLMRRVFDHLKQEFVQAKNKENEAILKLKGRASFEQWKMYYETRKAKRQLYDKFRALHHGKLKVWVYRGWKAITKKNQKTRDLTQKYLKFRTLKKWKCKLNQRVLLKNVFGTFIDKANYYFDFVPKNDFQLLSSIMKAWRNEVIENEHTASQKINTILGQNHHKQVLRVKIFHAWKNIAPRRRSLEIATRLFKNQFRNNVFKHWSYVAQYTNHRIANLQENKKKLTVLRCFQALYRLSLQSKLVKYFIVRRFFLKWSTHFHLKTDILPRRCYIHRIYRAFFDYLKEKRKSKIIDLKHKFIATQHRKKLEKLLLAKVFYRFMENMVKHRKKKVLYKRLAAFRNKRVLKRVLEAWATVKFIRLKSEQKKRMADLFREQKLNKWVRIPQGKKALSLQFQMLTLAFNGWRAHALKRKNVQHIVGRFRRFKDRITIRCLFNRWYQRYRDRKINSYELPSLNASFSRFLRTDADKMKRYEDKAFESRFTNETPSWQEEKAHSKIDSSDTDRELWLEGYRKNEEFLKKLREKREMEESYLKKYS